MIKSIKKLFAKREPDLTIYTATITVVFKNYPYFCAVLSKQFSARQVKAITAAVKSCEYSTLKEFPGYYVTKSIRIDGYNCRVQLERVYAI